ncbi:hypothetical protein [Cyclobacterium xiamenense]|uniref:hypothetical protein n=1 Tax=Cyclobacterium xiamenense TaxID=1297121 RepID=UPI0012B6F45D|nr:hypothetical protein [Cyclobacterium xiamenense]
MFVINPDPYLLPSYRISPFQTHQIAHGPVHVATEKAEAYFNERFGTDNWLLTGNGREGIRLALEELAVESGSLVTIQTTSNNRYISGCVTNTVADKCRWNRELGKETDVILENHEFGDTFSEENTLIQQGLTIIND